MPKILFASNSISHFPGSLIDAASYAFDASRVPYAIEAPLQTPISSPDIPLTTTDETWFHFVHSTNLWHTVNMEPICLVTNDIGDTIFEFHYHPSTGYRLRSFVNGNNFTNNRYYPNPSGRSRTYDIRLLQTSLNCRIEVYMNEILVEVQDYPIAAFRPVRNLVLGGAFGNAGNGQSFYSEIIVADGDTRNARLNLLRPQAVGAYNQWLGPVSALSDDDPTTGMTTTVTGQNQSTVLTPYTGAPNISNVVQMTTSVRGLNSPDRLRHLIRKSGVDYLSDPFTLPFEKAQQITDWAINPATSLPWTAADLVGMEFGFRSDVTP